jgi:ATP/maltotriose-dependent transcriptional regulator MalT
MSASPGRTFVCPLLIGRAAQINVIETHLRRALDGDPSTVLISGEAGVGKSRLVAESVEDAKDLGFTVVQGNCFEQDNTLPYSAILELLRSAFSSRPDDLIRLAGPLAGEVARIVPELLPGAAPAPATDPDQDRRRVFYALAQIFQSLASTEPLLIVIEDLHWSDETTRQFITYFVRQVTKTKDCRLLVFLTYRSEEVDPGLDHFLAGIERERLATEVALSPLTMAEVGVMVTAILGLQGRVQRDFLEALHERTEGNPLFVEEVLKSSAPAQPPSVEAGEPGHMPRTAAVIPRTVKDAVQQRASQLSAGARQLLNLAGVAGQRFDLGLLQSLTGETATGIADQIRELLAAQLVVEESADQFRFRHALTREAVYSSLLALERRELHRRIAERIEERAGESRQAIERHLSDLAVHFSRAEVSAKALLYGRLAGERAQALFTPSAAVQHLTQAVEAAGRLDAAPDPSLFRLRAASYEILGDFENALADHHTALQIARDLKDRPEEWEILLGLGMLWSARDYSSTRKYYEAALDLARSLGDQRLIARSLNRIGNYYINIEQPSKGIAHHEEALQIFESIDDAEGVAETVDLLGVGWLIGGDLRKSRAYYERAAQLFEEQDNRQGLVSCLTVLAVTSSVYHTETLPPATTYGAAAAQLARAHRIAVEIGHRSGECFALWNMGATLGPQGEYDLALQRTQEAIVIAEEIEHRQWLSAALFVLGAIQLDMLDFENARTSLEQALDLAKQSGSMLWTRNAAGYLSRCYLRLKEPNLASQTLDEALPSGSPAQTLGERTVQAARAELWLAEARATDALALLDTLEATQAVAPGEIVPALAKLRADALALTGDLDEAERLYVSAAAGAQDEGSLGHVWRIQAARCAMLEKSGDRDTARLARAEAVSAIDPIADRIEDETRRESFRNAALSYLPAVRSPSSRQLEKVASGGLTSREREIAALVAAGKSNAAIASDLVLSSRTVETHVTNILAKLGFASRSQIAAWAAERGLSHTSAQD